MGESGFAPSYPIETERLDLRPVDPVGDVDLMLAYRSRNDVCAYIPPEPATRASLEEFLNDPDRTRSVLDRAGQTLFLVLVRRDTGELIGDVILSWHSAEHRSGEIGYVLNPQHQKHGFATEAAAALLDVAFDELGLRRVIARTDLRNPRSGAVLQRLGMRREAVLVENEWFKGAWSTEVDYAILDREWHARRHHSGTPSAP